MVAQNTAKCDGSDLIVRAIFVIAVLGTAALASFTAYSGVMWVVARQALTSEAAVVCLWTATTINGSVCTVDADVDGSTPCFSATLSFACNDSAVPWSIQRTCATLDSCVDAFDPPPTTTVNGCRASDSQQFLAAANCLRPRVSATWRTAVPGQMFGYAVMTAILGWLVVFIICDGKTEEDGAQ